MDITFEIFWKDPYRSPHPHNGYLAALKEAIRKRLAAERDIQAIAVVHLETSTGVLNPSQEIVAIAGEFGVPLILVAGDNVLRDQVEVFNPATRFALTKTAISRSQAAARPTEEVLADIEAKALEAIQALAEIPAWTPELVDGSLTNHFSYTRTDHASLAVEFPGAVEVNDRTIALEFPTFLDSYLAYRALANFTSLAPMRSMFDAMRQVEGGMDTYRRIQEQLSGQMVIGFEPTGDEIDMGGSPRGRHGYK